MNQATTPLVRAKQPSPQFSKQEGFTQFLFDQSDLITDAVISKLVGKLPPEEEHDIIMSILDVKRVVVFAIWDKYFE